MIVPSAIVEALTESSAKAALVTESSWSWADPTVLSFIVPSALCEAAR